MGFVKRGILRIAVLVGAGYAGYRLLLDDAARENVRMAFKQVTKVTGEMVDRAMAMSGIDVADEGPVRESGRDAVYAQWENLGY